MDNSDRGTRGLNVTEQKMEKFYHVEKIIKIEIRNGQKYGVVKWQHFSHRENTLQPLSDLKEIVALKDDIERLQREFDLKDVQKNINKEIHRQINEELTRLYPSNEEQKKAKSNKHYGVTTYEQMKISVEVQKDIERRNKLGMRDMRPADYFYLLNVKYRIEDSVQKKIMLKRIPQTEYAITKIIGMQRCQEGFTYYIEMRQKMFRCEEQDMVEFFPIHYLNYLNYTTDFLKVHLGKDIIQEENNFKQRRHRQNSINYVKSVIAINQTLEAKKNPIFFGFNKEDAQKNREKVEARKNMDETQLQAEYIDPHEQLMKLYASIQKKSNEIRDRNRARGQKSKQKAAQNKKGLEKRSSASKSQKDLTEKVESLSELKKIPSQKSKSSPKESRSKSSQSQPDSTPKATPKSRATTPVTAVRRSKRSMEKKSRSASKK